MKTLKLLAWVGMCLCIPLLSQSQVPLTKTFEASLGNKPIESRHIETANNGDYLICGTYTEGLNDTRPFVMRTDKYGVEIWFKTYSISSSTSAYAEYIIELSGGELMVVGSAEFPSSVERATVLKLNSAGDVSWLKYYDENLPTPYSPPNSYAYHIIQLDGTENFVICGESNSTTISKTGFIMEISANGTVVNSGVYDNLNPSAPGWALFRRLVETSTGYAAVGSRSSNTTPSFYFNAIALEVDANNFNVNWSKEYYAGGSTNHWFGNDLVLENNGELTIVGQSNYLDGSSTNTATKFKISPTGFPIGNTAFLYGKGVFYDVLKTTAGGRAYSGSSQGYMTKIGLWEAGALDQGFLVIETPGMADQEHEFGGVSQQFASAEQSFGNGFVSSGHKNLPGSEILSLMITDPLGFVSPDPQNPCKETHQAVDVRQSWTPLYSTYPFTKAGEMKLHATEDLSNITVYQPSLTEDIKCRVTIEGHVYADLNHNGIYEPGSFEYPMPNREIRLIGDNGYETHTLTDANGLWSVQVLENSEYEIIQVMASGELITFPSTYEHVYSLFSNPPYFDFLNYICAVDCEAPEDMVAYLHFEETSGTSTYNLLGNDGTVSSSISSTTGAREDVIDTRGSTVGTSQTISVPHYQDIDFDNDAWSVEFYMSLYSMPVGQIELLSQFYSINGTATGHGWLLHLDNDGDIYMTQYDDDQTALKALQRGGQSSPDEIVPSLLSTSTNVQWIHIAVTQSDAGIVKLFVNGVLKSTLDFSQQGGNSLDFDLSPFPSSNPAVAAPIIIGDPFLDGAIDEISFYQRKLSQQEVEDVCGSNCQLITNKCWDYFRETTSGTQPPCNGSVAATGRDFTIYNGDLASKDFIWTLSGQSASGNCDVDGPQNFNAPNGDVTIPGSGNAVVSSFIPCDQTATTGTGCYTMTVLNETRYECGLTTGSATGLNRPSKPEYVQQNERAGTDEPIVSSLTEMNNQEQIQVFPNPSQNNFNVVIQNPSLIPISLKVFDHLGREVDAVINETGNPSELTTAVVDGSKLTNGIYFLTVQKGAEQKSIKLIKNQ